MRRPATPAPLVFLLVLPLLLLGCDSDPGYEHIYTARAIVITLPGAKVTQEFIVHHEAIPDYQSSNGSVGMNEMAMPIPVPDRAVLEGIAVGDKIEFVFGERFEPDHAMGVISVKKLPDDTKLSLGKPKD